MGYRFGGGDLSELTPVQERFVLDVVIPEMNRQNGAKGQRAPVASAAEGGSDSPALGGTLREKVERRRRDRQ